MTTTGTTPGRGDEGPGRRPLDDASHASMSSQRQLQVDPLTSSTIVDTPDSDHALHMEFYRRFYPAVAEVRNFSLSATAFAPTAPPIPTKLSELLKDPVNRSCAWRFISTIGIDGGFSVAERQALCAGLLSYVKQDKDQCVVPLIEIALYAAELREMELYKAVGEVVRASGLGDTIAGSTVAGFCDLSSYNAARQSEFHPWMEIYAQSASVPIYEQVASALASRVMDGQAGTYDHLLRTLCLADSPHAATVLLRLVGTSLPPTAEEIPKPDPVKVGLTIFTPICLGIVATKGLLEGVVAFRQSEPILTAIKTGLTYPPAWALGGVAGALGGLALVSFIASQRERLVAFFDSLRTHLQGTDYHHFAERTYARLGEAAPRNQYASKLRCQMESCDAYASVIEDWRRMYPLHAAPSNKDDTSREENS